MLAGETEKRLKSCHRCAAAVETEHVLVEIVLQVLLPDAVVSPSQPRLEIREDSVDPREMFGGVLSRSLCLASVLIALVGERSVAAPAVGMHDQKIVADLSPEVSEIR